ncbi:MAG TPA: hypothetical protein DDZ41_03195 [Flavobacterium sp.]|nr:hypothetical protein [Flavobacterium sp.]
MEQYYIRYYTNQTGCGNDENDQFLQIKIPRVYQRGRGVGSIFSSIWKFLQPILRKGATFASKELIETGSDILSGMANQKPVNTIIADRSIQLVDKLRDKAAEKIKSMAGAGVKRKSLQIKGSSPSKRSHLIGIRHPVKKKKQSIKKNKPHSKPRVIDIFS